MKISFVKCIIAISPILPNGTINELPSYRAQLIGLDSLARELYASTYKYLKLSTDEINKLIKILNLREGDIRLGNIKDESTETTSKYFVNIPSTPSLLIGRDQDVKELKNRLLGSKNDKKTTPNTQIITAMRGWPGVGKTTLAAALAHDADIIKGFPDGLLWASIGQQPDKFQELKKWAVALNIPNFEKIDTIEEIRNQIIISLRDKRILLIIDDVWKTEDAECFRLGGKKCTLLYTTRIPLVAEKIAPTAMDIYNLNVLTDKESYNLLNALAPQAIERYPNECSQLIKDIEGLPLALQVAGHLLNSEIRRGQDLTRLFKDFSDTARLIEAQAPSDRIDLAKDTTPTVAAILKKSTDYLDDQTRYRFAILVTFGEKPLKFDAEDMAGIWDISDPYPTISQLLDYGLIEYVDNDQYWMHSLLVKLAESLFIK